MARRSGHDLRASLLDECEAALRDKYFQYRGTQFADLLMFDVKSVSGWAAEPRADDKPDPAKDGVGTQTY
jgi:hypothetical protein